MIIKNRELTDQEVKFNNKRLQQLTLKDLINANSIMDLYYNLNLYISINNNGWSIKNNNINVDDSFLKAHYKNINNLKNKACIYTYKKLNLIDSILEYTKEIKDRFDSLYRKYFNFYIINYQKSLNITDDKIYFLTNDYQYLS